MATARMMEGSSSSPRKDAKGIFSDLPEEFYDLLARIAKQIMTHRPLNVYKFTANLLEHELDKRTLQEIAAEARVHSPKRARTSPPPSPVSKPVDRVTSAATVAAIAEVEAECVPAEAQEPETVSEDHAALSEQPMDTENDSVAEAATESPVESTNTADQASEDVAPSFDEVDTGNKIPDMSNEKPAEESVAVSDTSESERAPLPPENLASDASGQKDENIESEVIAVEAATSESAPTPEGNEETGVILGTPAELPSVEDTPSAEKSTTTIDVNEEAAPVVTSDPTDTSMAEANGAETSRVGISSENVAEENVPEQEISTETALPSTEGTSDGIGTEAGPASAEGTSDGIDTEAAPPSAEGTSDGIDTETAPASAEGTSDVINTEVAASSELVQETEHTVEKTEEPVIEESTREQSTVPGDSAPVNDEIIPEPEEQVSEVNNTASVSETLSSSQENSTECAQEGETPQETVSKSENADIVDDVAMEEKTEAADAVGNATEIKQNLALSTENIEVTEQMNSPDGLTAAAEEQNTENTLQESTEEPASDEPVSVQESTTGVLEPSEAESAQISDVANTAVSETPQKEESVSSEHTMEDGQDSEMVSDATESNAESVPTDKNLAEETAASTEPDPQEDMHTTEHAEEQTTLGSEVGQSTGGEDAASSDVQENIESAAQGESGKSTGQLVEPDAQEVVVDSSEQAIQAASGETGDTNTITQDQENTEEIHQAEATSDVKESSDENQEPLTENVAQEEPVEQNPAPAVQKSSNVNSEAEKTSDVGEEATLSASSVGAVASIEPVTSETEVSAAGPTDDSEASPSTETQKGNEPAADENSETASSAT